MMALCDRHPNGYELLPGKFTLPEITFLYETILGKKLDNRNFARRLPVTDHTNAVPGDETK
jgi:hypothetical protein